MMVFYCFSELCLLCAVQPQSMMHLAEEAACIMLSSLHAEFTPINIARHVDEWSYRHVAQIVLVIIATSFFTCSYHNYEQRWN